ncbi:MurR/RpiR family transcriptional regulator [Kutzneria buriramensis]|uniref:DNA-binding MurR/RpiR family transcriptional regulator n=1 Tax=Kutzneria buriramensis TaxID=1045776 RepID=A0A3E0HUP1_9PSEU|nr:MurR/RpiR family transcriptional regulator [Kutzneria buriramensis]REH50177.1 DNA-binding MurR/RpiR family transcriptional regulator [Kutzneria buriramensis]
MAPAKSASEISEASPLVRIRSLLPGLARAEQRVAKVVLDNPQVVAHRSITEVAEAAGTSETTVTRFCKAIGVGGYPELRIALAADTARTAARIDRDLGSDIAPTDDLSQVVGKVAFADARAVEETADQLDIATLSAVVDAVAGAGRVDVYGVGASAFVAADLQQKLHRIGRVSFAWSDTHIMLTSAAVLGSSDVAFGISHTGATADTVEALRVARERGATTVALTNFPRSPISEVADHVLTTAARETTFRSGAMASRIAQLTVIDCLFIGVAQKHLDSARNALESTYEAVGGHRLGPRPDGRRKAREAGK